MHERLKSVCRKIGVKKAGQRLAALGKVAWHKTEMDNMSDLRESLLAIWIVDIHKALRICEERHVAVEGSESSYISCDRVVCPRLSWLFGFFPQRRFYLPSLVVEFQRLACFTPLCGERGNFRISVPYFCSLSIYPKKKQTEKISQCVLCLWSWCCDSCGPWPGHRLCRHHLTSSHLSFSVERALRLRSGSQASCWSHVCLFIPLSCAFLVAGDFTCMPFMASLSASLHASSLLESKFALSRFGLFFFSKLL